jgi:hypothetical protein
MSDRINYIIFGLPDFLPFCVSSNHTIHDWRFSGFRVGILFSNSVDFDVLEIINIDELFIDVRPICSGMTQSRV